MILVISILWAFIGMQQFISLEGMDFSQATAAEKVIVSILFMVFGPCIMISNAILSMIELICGGGDDNNLFKY